MRRVAVAASFPAHPAPSAAACHRLVCSASSSEAATAEQQRRREEEGEEQGARAMTATRRDVHTLECSNLPYNVTPAEVATLFAEAGGTSEMQLKYPYQHPAQRPPPTLLHLPRVSAPLSPPVLRFFSPE